MSILCKILGHRWNVTPEYLHVKHLGGDDRVLHMDRCGRCDLYRRAEREQPYKLHDDSCGGYEYPDSKEQ